MARKRTPPHEIAKAAEQVPDYDPKALNIYSDRTIQKDLCREIRKHGTEKVIEAIKDSKSIASRKMRARATADALVHPETLGACIQSQFGESLLAGSELNWLISEMEASTARVVSGDVSEIERLLMSQAAALNTVFAALMRRGGNNIGNNLSVVETYIRLALKAQSQCRTTLETLAEIKNPRPVAFVKQANIANGPQQVNNGQVAREQFSSSPNKVLALEQQHVERLDFGAPSKAGKGDPELASVGSVNRSENG